jgi:hypothetical protein
MAEKVACIDACCSAQLWWEQNQDHLDGRPEVIDRRHALVTGENITRYMGRLMENEVR